MDGTFNLELEPGKLAALDVLLSSEELDMSKHPDGTMVSGKFVGTLDIIHNYEDNDHRMEFTGTRTQSNAEINIDAKAVTKLKQASRAPSAKCRLSIYPPETRMVEVVLSTAALWKIGTTYPEADRIGENRVKWYAQVHPNSEIESDPDCASLYYEAL